MPSGDLAEQHPEMLVTVLISGVLLVLPEGFILRPILGLFGFGPYSPVKGTSICPFRVIRGKHLTFIITRFLRCLGAKTFLRRRGSCEELVRCVAELGDEGADGGCSYWKRSWMDGCYCWGRGACNEELLVRC